MYRNILTRASALRMNYPMIPPASVGARKTFLARVLTNGSYLDPETKRLQEKALNRKPDEMPESPFNNEAMMENMMEQAKRSLLMMVPQTMIMGWVNFFFTGFVLSTYGKHACLFVYPFFSHVQFVCHSH